MNAVDGSGTRRILLVGRNGQVGRELRRTLEVLGDVIGLGRAELDLTREGDIRRTVEEHGPDVIVNAAAYTAVDRAEKEPDLAFSVNSTAPRLLAEAARDVGALLVHYSTDYVFDGEKGEPYDEEDLPNPLNVYGRSKLEGERAIQEVGGDHLILRTAWVYGLHGRNFVVTMLRLAETRDEIRVVDDQVGSPTSSGYVAETTAKILRTWHDTAKPSGLYHLACRGQTTWYHFARLVFEHRPPSTGLELVPVSTSMVPTEARRPPYSVLSTHALERDYGIVSPGFEQVLTETIST